jgi:hypothetical protein
VALTEQARFTQDAVCGSFQLIVAASSPGTRLLGPPPKLTRELKPEPARHRDPQDAVSIVRPEIPGDGQPSAAATTKVHYGLDRIKAHNSRRVSSLQRLKSWLRHQQESDG